MSRRLADDHSSLGFGLEADDQADFLVASAHLIPRQPHAIGMADLRLAVVGGQLLGSEDVLAVGFGVAGVPIRFVKRVDHDHPINFDRLLILGLIEHEPSAETAHRRLVGLIQDGVGPDGHDFFGSSGFVVAQGPRYRFIQVPGGATDGRCQAEREP